MEGVDALTETRMNWYFPQGNDEPVVQKDSYLTTLDNIENFMVVFKILVASAGISYYTTPVILSKNPNLIGFVDSSKGSFNATNLTSNDCVMLGLVAIYNLALIGLVAKAITFLKPLRSRITTFEDD